MIIGAVLLVLVGSLYAWHRYAIHQELGELRVQTAAFGAGWMKVSDDENAALSLSRGLDAAINDAGAATAKRRAVADAISDFGAVLKYAKQEQHDVEGMRVSDLADAYDKECTDVGQLLGSEAVAKARSDLGEYRTQLGLMQTNWERAIGLIVDTGDEYQRNRYVPPVVSGSDIDHYYQDSASANVRAQTARAALAHDLETLSAHAAQRSRGLDAQIAVLEHTW